MFSRFQNNGSQRGAKECITLEPANANGVCPLQARMTSGAVRSGVAVKQVANPLAQAPQWSAHLLAGRGGAGSRGDEGGDVLG